jgi:GLPGLI family protein
LVLSTGKLYCYDRVGYTVYRYNEPATLFKWKILPGQSSIIAGYSCQKATTTYAGREYEAWFTREVPISEGPYKFYGLPGFIVKIRDTRKQYDFELVKLTKPKKPVLIALLTEDVLPTTKATLRRGQLDYELGMLDRVAAMGNKEAV